MITIESKPRSAAQMARSAAIRAANDAKRHARYLAQLAGPRKVGSVCFCGYWRTVYTVTAIHTENPDHPSITCLWHACQDRKEHTTTHCTHWDARKGDRIISQPEAAQ